VKQWTGGLKKQMKSRDGPAFALKLPGCPDKCNSIRAAGNGWACGLDTQVFLGLGTARRPFASRGFWLRERSFAIAHRMQVVGKLVLHRLPAGEGIASNGCSGPNQKRVFSNL